MAARTTARGTGRRVAEALLNDGRRRIGGLVAAMAFAFAAGPAAAQEIGAVIDVNPEAFGTPPASRPAELSMGEGVVANELIQTLAGAATRIRFLFFRRPRCSFRNVGINLMIGSP